MEPIVTCKFGGSSLADSDAVKRVVSIVQKNSNRRCIVVSAPGKRSTDDEKVTDLLLAVHAASRSGEYDRQLRTVAARFQEIAAGLGLRLDVEGEFHDIRVLLRNPVSRDEIASRGEYLMAKLMAEALDARFVDARDVIRMRENGTCDIITTMRLFEAAVRHGERIVVPGFYGSLASGAVCTFPRNGSDISGAIVARATGSSLYENWTEVPGILSADPKVVDFPAPVSELTYQELRELAYMGASVFHQEAVLPVREAGIPIHVRSTTNPTAPGTYIVPDGRTESPRVVTGIAGKRGFCTIRVEKPHMNEEVGFLAKLLHLFREHEISVEHVPTGIDEVSVVLPMEALDPQMDYLCDRIRDVCGTDAVLVEPSLALLSVVGRGMKGRLGLLAGVTKALADAGINIRTISQSSKELSIIVGVDDSRYEDAIRALYDSFIRPRLPNSCSG